MSLNITQGVVEKCRVLALSATGDVLCQTPTRHTGVGLEKAREIVNWQSGWLRRKYPELFTRSDVIYKLQWYVDGEWRDHADFDNTGLRNLNRKQTTETPRNRPHVRQVGVSLGAKFNALRKATREANNHLILDPPPVPRWIRKFPSNKIDGWTNKFYLMPRDPNLYSESLRVDWKSQFDDWKGNILLLSKDPCPTEKVEQMVEKGVSFLHRAQSDLGDESGFGTNNKLYDFASVIPGGKLFGSACANMLCDKSGYRRNIFKEFCQEPLHGYFKDVLSWVVETISNIDWIACLGKEAWFLTCATMGDLSAASQFSEYRNSYRPKRGVIANKNIVAFPLFHPAALGTYINEMPNGWRAFAKLIEKKRNRKGRGDDF
jgi:hypothetical protein